MKSPKGNATTTAKKRSQTQDSKDRPLITEHKTPTSNASKMKRIGVPKIPSLTLEKYEQKFNIEYQKSKTEEELNNLEHLKIIGSPTLKRIPLEIEGRLESSFMTEETYIQNPLCPKIGSLETKIERMHTMGYKRKSNDKKGRRNINININTNTINRNTNINTNTTNPNKDNTSMKKRTGSFKLEMSKISSLFNNSLGREELEMKNSDDDLFSGGFKNSSGTGGRVQILLEKPKALESLNSTPGDELPIDIKVEVEEEDGLFENKAIKLSLSQDEHEQADHSGRELLILDKINSQCLLRQCKTPEVSVNRIAKRSGRSNRSNGINTRPSGRKETISTSGTRLSTLTNAKYAASVRSPSRTKTRKGTGMGKSREQTIPSRSTHIGGASDRYMQFNTEESHYPNKNINPLVSIRNFELDLIGADKRRQVFAKLRGKRTADTKGIKGGHEPKIKTRNILSRNRNGMNGMGITKSMNAMIENGENPSILKHTTNSEYTYKGVGTNYGNQVLIPFKERGQHTAGSSTSSKQNTRPLIPLPLPPPPQSSAFYNSNPLLSSRISHIPQELQDHIIQGELEMENHQVRTSILLANSQKNRGQTENYYSPMLIPHIHPDKTQIPLPHINFPDDIPPKIDQTPDPPTPTIDEPIYNGKEQEKVEVIYGYIPDTKKKGILKAEEKSRGSIGVDAEGISTQTRNSMKLIPKLNPYYSNPNPSNIISNKEPHLGLPTPPKTTSNLQREDSIKRARNLDDKHQLFTVGSERRLEHRFRAGTSSSLKGRVNLLNEGRSPKVGGVGVLGLGGGMQLGTPALSGVWKGSKSVLKHTGSPRPHTRPKTKQLPSVKKLNNYNERLSPTPKHTTIFSLEDHMRTAALKSSDVFSKRMNTIGNIKRLFGIKSRTRSRSNLGTVAYNRASSPFLLRHVNPGNNCDIFEMQKLFQEAFNIGKIDHGGQETAMDGDDGDACKEKENNISKENVIPEEETTPKILGRKRSSREGAGVVTLLSANWGNNKYKCFFKKENNEEVPTGIGDWGIKNDFIPGELMYNRRKK